MVLRPLDVSIHDINEDGAADHNNHGDNDSNGSDKNHNIII